MQKPIKSVLNPTAQNNRLCEPGTIPTLSEASQRRLANLYRTEPTPVSVIVSLLVDYGLRISEVLSVKPTDITADGRLIIKGSKKSSDRLIVCAQYKEFLIGIRNGSFNWFNSYNRFQIYRKLKNYGLVSESTYGSKNAVCHQFRYSFVKDVDSVTNNVAVTAKMIGHKNSSNTKIYLNGGK